MPAPGAGGQQSIQLLTPVVRSTTVLSQIVNRQPGDVLTRLIDVLQTSLLALLFHVSLSRSLIQRIPDLTHF